MTSVPAKAGFGVQDYKYLDEQPSAGTAYYRICINYAGNAANKFTEVKSIRTGQVKEFINILPNPVTETADIRFNAPQQGEAFIKLFDRSGRNVLSQYSKVEAGTNNLRLTNLSIFPAGAYSLRITINGKTSGTTLVIHKP